jgi:fermentation-respiration switch protein FrsA (DUF1100 family)
MKTVDLSSQKFRFFRLPSIVLIAISLLLLFSVTFYWIRRLEFMATYAPRAYVPGSAWTLPANGEEVWFEVANGQRVHGWFLRSSLQPAIATVLFCHGNGGDLTDVSWQAEKLSQRNLNVLIFDYRGYGRSEGTLTDEWGLYADTEAARNYLIRERGVQASMLVFYGQSLGTAAAINDASQHPCKALIVESGLSSASDMGAVAFPWLPRWLHRLGKNRFESARKIANVKCSVLVTHGTNDPIVPVEQGRKLYESARDPKRLLMVPNGGHNLFGNGGEAYLDQVVNFIRESGARP